MQDNSWRSDWWENAPSTAWEDRIPALLHGPWVTVKSLLVGMFCSHSGATFCSHDPETFAKNLSDIETLMADLASMLSYVGNEFNAVAREPIKAAHIAQSSPSMHEFVYNS